MAELLAIGTADARSADFTLTAGQEAFLILKDAAGPTVDPYASALIQVKIGAEYFTIGELDGQKNPAQVLKAVGTFAVFRQGGRSCGVEQN